jgi:hypothetical protein
LSPARFYNPSGSTLYTDGRKLTPIGVHAELVCMQVKPEVSPCGLVSANGVIGVRMRAVATR